MTFKLNQQTVSKRRYNGAIAFSVSSTSGPTISGGELYSDATHYYRVFRATDTLSVSNSTLTGVEILCVAGGGYPGAGIYQWWNSRWVGGGGGGAGGVLLSTNQTFNTGEYLVVVGAAGNDSKIISNSTDLWVAIAGGQGGSTNNDGWGPGSNGGSGGGGDFYGTGGLGTSGQGYNGGNGVPWNGGGGGGAGGPGGNAGNPSGDGGVGIYLPEWAAATGTGVDGGYYAGGGGGRWYTPGLGARTSAPNTGSGGTIALANPSSGIVIVRWEK